MPQRPDAALLLCYERPYEVGRLVAEPQDMSSGEPRGWTLLKFDKKTWLSGLQITGYIDDQHSEVWCWDTTYRAHGQVELRQAEVMVTILRQVESGLRKEIAQSGYAATYFEYLTSVARILGISRYLIRHDHHERQQTGEWYRTATAEDVRLWVARQEKIHCKPSEHASA